MKRLINSKIYDTKDMRELARIELGENDQKTVERLMSHPNTYSSHDDLLFWISSPFKPDYLSLVNGCCYSPTTWLETYQVEITEEIEKLI